MIKYAEIFAKDDECILTDAHSAAHCVIRLVDAVNVSVQFCATNDNPLKPIGFSGSIVSASMKSLSKTSSHLCVEAGARTYALYGPPGTTFWERCDYQQVRWQRGSLICIDGKKFTIAGFFKKTRVLSVVLESSSGDGFCSMSVCWMHKVNPSGVALCLPEKAFLEHVAMMLWDSKAMKFIFPAAMTSKVGEQGAKRARIDPKTTDIAEGNRGKARGRGRGRGRTKIIVGMDARKKAPDRTKSPEQQCSPHQEEKPPTVPDYEFTKAQIRMEVLAELEAGECTIFLKHGTKSAQFLQKDY